MPRNKYFSVVHCTLYTVHQKRYRFKQKKNKIKINLLVEDMERNRQVCWLPYFLQLIEYSCRNQAMEF